MPTRIEFGTDGWRAIIAEDFTFDNVRICAQAVADWLHQEGSGRRGPGRRLRHAVRLRSLRRGGGRGRRGQRRACASLRPRPSPRRSISYSVKDRQAGGGVVITASHNPASYNGFKVKGPYAGSASPEIVEVLHQRIKVHQRNRRGVQRMALAEAQATAARGADRRPAAATGRRWAGWSTWSGCAPAGCSIVARPDVRHGHRLLRRPARRRQRPGDGDPQREQPGLSGVLAPEPIPPNLNALLAAVVAARRRRRAGDRRRLGPHRRWSTSRAPSSTSSRCTRCCSGTCWR